MHLLKDPLKALKLNRYLKNGYIDLQQTKQQAAVYLKVLSKDPTTSISVSPPFLMTPPLDNTHSQICECLFHPDVD